ncbi:MAG: hypothetical protein ABI649_07110 [Gaiellaceae bacterium]
MSSSRASRLALITAVSLLCVPAAFAQEPGETTTGTTTETASTTEPVPEPWAETPQTRLLLRQATRYKRTARRLHRLMGKPRPRVAGRPAGFDSLLAYRQWLRRTWRSRAVRAQERARRPPHLGAWRCIHRHEGPWRDPNSPYFGGLQMDLTFQRQYGPDLLRKKGTADRWTPFEQMWVAERALRSGRGFYPWPLTARRCGLI